MTPQTAEKDKPGKIFLGNLDFGTVESTIRNSFEKYGKIAELNIIKNKLTGDSRGFGFVTYETPEDADDAVKAMDGKELDGHTIKVDHALKSYHLSQGERGRGRGRGLGRGGERGGRDGGYDGGRGRGTPPMMSRGRGGPMRGRGGYPPRGALRGGRGGREPLLSTPMDSDYGMDEQDSLYDRSASRFKESLGRPRGSRPLAYGRDEDAPPTDRSSRPTQSYGRQPSSYDSPSTGRDGRSSAYGREPAAYDSLSSERASRAPPSSYSRADPDSYRRDSSGYGREQSAHDRSSSYPAERETPAVSRRAGLDEDLYSNRPAALDYGTGRTATRDYGQERSSRTEVSRDSYTRDPYAATAREAAPERDYGDRSREQQPATREREAYAAGRSFATPATREPTSRSAYPAVRGYENREHVKPPATRDYAAERNGSYTRERESYGETDQYAAAAADPYGRTADRDAGGSGASSRFESYSARDPYASTARSEKPAYGARDPYGSGVSARGARTEGSTPGGSRGYARR